MEGEINSFRDFEKKYNYRVAGKCCGSCKHGELEYEGNCTCHHPARFDFGRDNDQRIMSYNAVLCCVCDAWEKSDNVGCSS